MQVPEWGNSAYVVRILTSVTSGSIMTEEHSKETHQFMGHLKSVCGSNALLSNFYRDLWCFISQKIEHLSLVVQWRNEWTVMRICMLH